MSEFSAAAIEAPRRSARQAAIGVTARRTEGAPDAAALLRELVRNVSLGDQEALAGLYDATVARVYSLAVRMLGNEACAEEVTMDVYMQIWRDAGTYDAARAPVLAWMSVICRSRALDALRVRHDPQPDLEPWDEEIPDAAVSDPMEALERAEERRALGRGLAALTPLERQLLTLAFYRGFTHCELASHVAFPLGTVKTVLRRALRKMRTAMKASALRKPA